MGAKLPLPKPDAMPATVLFHRDSPTEEVIVLQVPDADRVTAATYILRTTEPDDMAWLDRLKESKELRHQLTLEQHIAYDPATGHMEPIADLDTPSDLQMAIGMARYDIDQQPMRRMFDPGRGGNRITRMSPFRRMLSGFKEWGGRMLR